MSITKKLAASSKSFAHLLGISAKAEDEKKDEELSEEEKQGDDESDEDYEKRTGKKAEDEDSKAGAEDDKKDAEDDEDEADAEDEKDEKSKAARSRESARCARIIAHGIKHGCVNQAGVFAFDTRMSVSQAITAMGASKLDGSRNGLKDRMAAAPLPRVSADAPAAAPQTAAQQIIAAGKKRRGETA